MKNRYNAIRLILLILFCGVLAQTADAAGYVVDANGNLLSTTEGKATQTRSLNVNGKDMLIVLEEFTAQLAGKTSTPTPKKKVTPTPKKTTPKKKVTPTPKKTTPKKKVTPKQKKTIPKKPTPKPKKTIPKKPTPKPKKPIPKKPTPKPNNQFLNPDNDQWEESCSLCGGSGNCITCHGAGQYHIQSVGTMWPCGRCYSSGRCNMCEGRGKNVFRVYKQNGIRYMQRNSERPMVIGEGDKVRRCGACSGFGRCAACHGSGRSVSYTAGKAPICPTCGGSGRCSKCGGSGYK